MVSENIIIDAVYKAGKAGATRWVNALVKAGGIIRAGGKELVDALENAEGKYNASHTGCDCPAGQHGFPCKHRALIILYDRISDAEEAEGAC